MSVSSLLCLVVFLAPFAPCPVSRTHQALRRREHEPLRVATQSVRVATLPTAGEHSAESAAGTTMCCGVWEVWVSVHMNGVDWGDAVRSGFVPCKSSTSSFTTCYRCSASTKNRFCTALVTCLCVLSFVLCHASSQCGREIRLTNAQMHAERVVCSCKQGTCPLVDSIKAVRGMSRAPWLQLPWSARFTRGWAGTQVCSLPRARRHSCRRR